MAPFWFPCDLCLSTLLLFLSLTSFSPASASSIVFLFSSPLFLSLKSPLTLLVFPHSLSPSSSSSVSTLPVSLLHVYHLYSPPSLPLLSPFPVCFFLNKTLPLSLFLHQGCSITISPPHVCLCVQYLLMMPGGEGAKWSR